MSLDPRIAIHHHARLGSTNDEALRLAGENAPDRTIVIADEQTGGRGRRGRAWASAPGNLYLSMIVDGGKQAAAPGLLSLAVGVAAAEACGGYGARVRLKWPNDLMIDDAKLAGILIEAAAPWRYVVGLGVNLTHAPALPGRATVALAEAAPVPPPTVESFLETLLPLLMGWADRWHDGAAEPIRSAWLARAHRLGHTITLMNGHQTMRGIFRGLGDDGALLLESGGATHVFHAGEVSLGAEH